MSDDATAPAPAPAPALGPAPPTPSEVPERSGRLFALFFVLLAVGVGAAIYLVQHKLRISLDPTHESHCSVSQTIDCDTVNNSPWSSLLGLPIALYAVPTYLFMAWLGFEAWRRRREEDPAERVGAGVAMDMAATVGLVATAVSLVMAAISTGVIGKICPYCSVLYVVSIATTVLALVLGPRGPLKALSKSLTSLAIMRQPLLPAFGVLVIVTGTSWVAFDAWKEGLEASYRATIDAQFAALDAAMAEPADPGSEATATATDAMPAAAAAVAVAPAPTPPPTPRAVGQQPSLADPRAAVKKGKKTDNGWSWFQTPLSPDEFFYGKVDSPVTVVKFADFECSYCRLLANSMKQVKEKYGDRVRFVMKQFPMDPKCNRYMASYDKHPHACDAAFAGHCAGVQGRFWEMHDAMYDNQEDLDPASLRGYAKQIGLDLAAYDACLKDPATNAFIQNDIAIAIQAGINGTPKTFIGNRMVAGSATRSILEYYIDKALEEAATGKAAAAAPAPAAQAPKPDGTHMIQAKAAGGAFWIDPYEASITADGRAVSLPDVEPAQASWFDAKAACEKAGKRLCTEEEWISACTGVPAVDNNSNGWFSDDTVEGPMYPYGLFYQAGSCHDQADKYAGRPVNTGSKARCRGASGIHDQAGNIGEWVNPDENKATLMGGYASSGERAACNQRSYGSGAGRRNHTTGFRCCADQDVTQKPVDADDLKETVTELLNRPAPDFSMKDTDGKVHTNQSLKGKVTLVNFFASWCGPCKKEIPYLVQYQDYYGEKGFQVIGIGTDGSPDRSIEFAEGYDVNYPVVTDPESKLMGLFGVYSMPATFIVDREGVVRYKDTGFKPEEQATPLKRAIERLTGG